MARSKTRFRTTLVVEFEALDVKTAKQYEKALGALLIKDRGYVKDVSLPVGKVEVAGLHIATLGDLTVKREGEDVVPDGSDNACWCCDEPHDNDSRKCPGECGELVHAECIHLNDPKGRCEVCVENDPTTPEEWLK